MEEMINEINNLKFAIKEMKAGGAPEETINTSKELLAKYRKELYNAKRRERYHNDPEYRERQKAWKNLHGDERRAAARHRYHNDPEYRERKKASAREAMKKHYYESEEYRNRYRNNPRFKEALKRAVKRWQAANPDKMRGYFRKRYCCDDISNVENYELAKADDFKGWHLHHRFETHTSDGERRLVDISMDELKALGMYWNRPASELIYMRMKEHRVLHNENLNKRRRV